MSSNGRWIRLERRLAIYCRDDFRCVYCGDDLVHAEARGITLDHVVPRCGGGGHASENLVTACLTCNSSRGCGALRGEVLARVDRQTRLPWRPFMRHTGMLVRLHGPEIAHREARRLARRRKTA